ncbi:MAG: sulfur reduction protein DsrJ [Candidatus Thiodiazotropha sp.]
MRSSLISKRILIGLLAGMLIPVMQAFGEGSHVTKNSKAASMDSCVAPTEIMRRNHMDYLKHERDETVREGIRGGKFSLVECVNCHASTDEKGQPIPVTDKGEFCQSCHSYVAVELPCFQCHRTTPQKPPIGYVGYGHPGAVSGAVTQIEQPAGLRETDHEQ